MPFFHHDDKLLFFAHAPKTGGSSVEDYLIRRFDDIFLYCDRPRQRKGRGSALIAPVGHLCAWDLEVFLPSKLDLIFAVVRNPLDRVLSEYRWQAGASRVSRLNFSTWLHVMISAARIEPRTYDNHIRPTSDLVPEAAEVFRLEDGFDAMIARIDEVTDSSAPNLSVGHLKNRGDKGPSVRVTRQDARLIADYYAVDYERFGYPFPDPDNYDNDGMALARTLAAGPIARLAVAKQRRDWLS